MGSTAYAAYNNGAANGGSAHTVTAMGRWSILNKQLPAADAIKAIHVYDFDNTRGALSLALPLSLSVCVCVADPLILPQSSRPPSPTPSSGTARQ